MISEVLKRKVLAFYQQRSRYNRRKFNDLLTRYKYLVLFPYGEDDLDSTTGMVACRYFHITFTNDPNPVNPEDCSASNRRGTNEFSDYVESPFANLVFKDIFFDTSDIEPLYISPAPLELLLDEPSTGTGDLEFISYLVSSFLQVELPYACDSMIISALNNDEVFDFKLEIIRQDIGKMISRNGTPLSGIQGRQTHRLVVDGKVIAFVECSGRELQHVEAAVLHEREYIAFMNKIADESGIRTYIDKPYKVMVDLDNVDQYVSTPNITGYANGETRTEDKL